MNAAWVATLRLKLEKVDTWRATVSEHVLEHLRARLSLRLQPPHAAAALLRLLPQLQPASRPHSRLHQLRASAKPGRGQSPAALCARALKHERELNLEAATHCLEAALGCAPAAWLNSEAGVEALVRLGKQSSDIGWHAFAAAHGLACAAHAVPPPGSLASGLFHAQEGLTLAEECVALWPASARAHTALAVAAGRVALFTPDIRSRVALAGRIRTAAEQALVLSDGAEDVAHHVLGRWHAEVAGLSPVGRLLARALFRGPELKGASHAAALQHYETAVELAPRRLTHRTELGKVLLRLGRRREAIASFRAALACDLEDVNAVLGRVTAERQLRKLWRHERRALRQEARAARRASRAEAKAAKVAARA